MTKKIRLHLETHEPGKVSLPRMLAADVMWKRVDMALRSWRRLYLFEMEIEVREPLRRDLLGRSG